MRTFLCGGFLAGELGALAITCRYLGGRRSAGLWEQPPGLSAVEAAARVRLRFLPIRGCPLLLEFPLCRSAGRALLSRAFATPALKIEGGTLRGWDKPGARLVIPHGVTAIADKAFERACVVDGRFKVSQGL